MKKFGLLGEKLSHSLSSKIHNYIFKKYSIDAEYSLVEVPREDITSFALDFKEKSFSGLNVTIPYKEDMLKHMDFLSDEVKKIGALNVIDIKDGVTHGYNTDYLGFIELLKKFNVNAKDKKVFILGNGGSCKAVREAFRSEGAKDIFVVTRKINNKKDDFFKLITYENELRGDIIVNTTPLGMFPNVNNSPISKETISNFECAIDIIYNPDETLFLKTARELGLKTVSGITMLIEQAIKSDEIWFDRTFDEDLFDELDIFLKGVINENNGN